MGPQLRCLSLCVDRILLNNIRIHCKRLHYNNIHARLKGPPQQVVPRNRVMCNEPMSPTPCPGGAGKGLAGLLFQDKLGLDALFESVGPSKILVSVTHSF